MFPSGYTAGFPVLELASDKDKRIISKAADFDEKYVGRNEFPDETICNFAPKLMGNEREVKGPLGHVYGEFPVGNHVAYF